MLLEHMQGEFSDSAHGNYYASFDLKSFLEDAQVAAFLDGKRVGGIVCAKKSLDGAQEARRWSRAAAKW